MAASASDALIDDLDSFVTELEAKGVEILGRQNESYGKFAWILDCDGLKLELEDWDLVLGVDLRGVFLGAREAARRMIGLGRGGVIVNVPDADERTIRLTVPPRFTTYSSPASSSPNDETFIAVSSSTDCDEPFHAKSSPEQ